MWIERKIKLENLLEQYRNIEKITSDNVKQFVQDKSIPLEKRWTIFILSGMGIDEDWTQYPCGVDLDFDFDRCTEVSARSWVDIYSSILQKQEEGFSSKQYAITVDEVKEWFLKKFMKSYKYDW